jgi:hydroxypyruvate isomerase
VVLQCQVFECFFNHLGRGIRIDAQVADSPGRHEPGTEEIHCLNALAALDTPGYQGYVGLEYNPTTSSEASLAWLPEDRSGMLAVSDLRL